MDGARSNAASGSVGIFHETYVVAPGTVESLYVDIPADLRLGGAVGPLPISGALDGARQRKEREAASA